MTCSSPVPQSRACRDPLVEFLPGRFQHAARRKPVPSLERFRYAAEDVPFPSAHLPPFAQQLDATLLKRPARIGDQPLGVERVDLSQPAALRTHALRTVEAEQLWAGRLEALLAVGAGVVGGEGEVGSKGCGDVRQGRGEGGTRTRRHLLPRVSVSPCPRVSASPRPRLPSSPRPLHPQPQSGCLRPGARPPRRPPPAADEAWGQPRAGRLRPRCCAAFAGPTADRRSAAQRVRRPGPDEPLFQQIFEEVAVFSLLAANERGQNEEPRTRGQYADAVNNLHPCLGRDRPAALRTVTLAHSAKSTRR